MFVIVQVDIQRDQPVRVIPVKYSVESEAQAHAEVLTSRAGRHRYVVRTFSEPSPVAASPAR